MYHDDLARQIVNILVNVPNVEYVEISPDLNIFVSICGRIASLEYPNPSAADVASVAHTIGDVAASHASSCDSNSRGSDDPRDVSVCVREHNGTYRISLNRR